MTFATWLALFAASWAISLSPGPGAIAAMSSGHRLGFRRGYWTTAGLILGGWTQLVVVGAGLGALLAASTTAFELLKWAGAAYLVYLGWQQWRAPIHAVEHDRAAMVSDRRDLILHGWAVNAVNPKGTVFLLAIVPLFIDPARPLWLQYLIVAVTLSLTDAVVMAGYTALASRLMHWLRTPRRQGWMNRTFGALFVAMGAALAGFSRTA